MIDGSTKQEIDRVVMKTLKEADMREPPFLVSDLLDHLKIDSLYRRGRSCTTCLKQLCTLNTNVPYPMGS